MAILSLAVKHRIFAALLAAIITPTAIAGFIYTWQDDSPNGFDVSGMISFGDEINFGDIVDSVASIQAFDFLVTDSDGEFRVQFDRDDISLNVPFLVGPGGLNETGKKMPALEPDQSFFDLASDGGVLQFEFFDKKKAATKKGDTPNLDLIVFTDWFGIGEIFRPDPGTVPNVKKKLPALKKIVLDIQGQWTLVSLPEPASFVLMLIGLFAIGGLLKRPVR